MLVELLNVFSKQLNIKNGAIGRQQELDRLEHLQGGSCHE